MARNNNEAPIPTVYECIEPFSPAVGANGVPDVYGFGHQVLEGHPVLKRYGAHFEPVTDRVLRRERATLPAGVPAEPRSFAAPNPPNIEINEQENTNAQG